MRLHANDASIGDAFTRRADEEEATEEPQEEKDETSGEVVADAEAANDADAATEEAQEGMEDDEVPAETAETGDAAADEEEATEEPQEEKDETTGEVVADAEAANNADAATEEAQEGSFWAALDDHMLHHVQITQFEGSSIRTTATLQEGHFLVEGQFSDVFGFDI
eukprot:s3121_g15.t1